MIKNFFITIYFVQNSSPALHGYALKYSQNGREYVVKRCNAIIGTFPSVFNALDILGLDKYLIRTRKRYFQLMFF